ncbi:MAG: 4-hydroxy-3-methylbut-2-enyl diphosphate reductase [Gammaproteobacteria bacterium]|nr:4-hydroxy-3-methylbut-2-enyl diphosphate reductase [Gammaproteobacteria bacterium]
MSKSPSPKTVALANPRGFCAGVDRAILIVERAIELLGAPIYVRNEVVHNKFVVNGLREKGAIFVKELDEVPDDSTVIFSAHGVSKAVQLEARRRGLKVFDATCPLVTKVHIEVSRYSRKGFETILIGHAGHPEVVGTMGQYNNPDGGMYLVETLDDVDKLPIKDEDNLYYVSQTTLSVDETREIIEGLRKKFVNIKGPSKDDICYATQNRQDAVRELAKSCDLVLVVGSVNSSNSNRLRELAEINGVTAYLIDNASEIDESWLDGAKRIGVTAGASAPEVLVQEVLSFLKERDQFAVQQLDGREERVHFNLPKPLRVKT